MGVNWLTNRFLQKFFRICQSMNELQGLVSRFKLYFSPFITTRVLKATRGDDSRVRSCYVSLRHDLEQFFFLFFFEHIGSFSVSWRAHQCRYCVVLAHYRAQHWHMVAPAVATMRHKNVQISQRSYSSLHWCSRTRRWRNLPREEQAISSSLWNVIANSLLHAAL